MTQLVLSRLERGESKRPSAHALTGLSRLFGVDVTLHEAETPPEAQAAPVADEADLESAVFAAIDPSRYCLAVFDAARRVARETAPYIHEEVDLQGLARRYLEAAASLHREGEPLSTSAIMATVINGW